MSNATTADVTVSIATSGTATEGTDYTDGSGNIDDIVITAGSTSETISFRPTDDSVYEGDETATISISGVLVVVLLKVEHRKLVLPFQK